MNSNVRKITDGAMMLAIVGAAVLLDRQTAGLIYGLVSFLLPLPMVFYSVKYGWRDSWMVFGAMLLLAFILESLPGMFLIGGECLIGLVYGASIHAKANSHRTLIRTMITAVIYDLCTMIIFADFFGYDLAAEMEEYRNIMNTVFTQTGVDLLQNVNVDSYLVTVFIVAAIVTGILEAYVVHVISRLMLKRLRIAAPPSVPLYAYYPPKWSGYVGILGFIAYYTGISGRFAADPMIESALQGFGMAMILYLAFFGMFGLMLFIKLRFPHSRLAPMLVILAMLFIAMSLVALFGFLYITTDMHERMLQRAVYSAGQREEVQTDESEDTDNEASDDRSNAD